MGGNNSNSYYLHIRYLPLFSFSTVPGSNETDLRTLYCAFAISSVLNDWSGVDIARGTAFIATCRVIYLFYLIRGFRSPKIQTYEGGYGQSTFCEAQGRIILTLLFIR